jgi:hypothetical protein
MTVKGEILFLVRAEGCLLLICYKFVLIHLVSDPFDFFFRHFHYKKTGFFLRKIGMGSDGLGRLELSEGRDRQ